MRCVALLACLAAGVSGALAAGGASGQVTFHGEASGARVQVMSWRDIPFRTVVRQEHDYSCGSAALATLLTFHYGVPTTEPEAFTEMFAKGDQAKIRKVGFSLLDMKRYLESHGIAADGYRTSLDELQATGAPVIALIDLGAYRHFVVVKGVTAKGVLVGDPALGLRTYSRVDFLKVWNGVSLSLHPGGKLPPPVFNAQAEWRPWSTAPLHDVELSGDLGALTRDLTPLYQISGMRPFDAVQAGF